MDNLDQNHSGPGNNIGGNQINYNYNNPGSANLPPSRYLNAFAHYDLVNLVGREQQLEAIENHLAQHHMLLLHGIGGIGKTTLAKAYISKAHDKYDHIAYVEIIGSIAESMLSQLGNSSDAGLQGDPATDPESKFKALIDILRHIPKLLLVLDNANDADDLLLRKQQLASLDAKVLITGRAKPLSFVQQRAILEIGALTSDEAVRLFKNHYTQALTETETLLVEHMLKEAFCHPKLVEVIAKAAQVNYAISLEGLSEIVGKKRYNDEEINFPIEIDDKTKKVYRVLHDLFNTDNLSEDLVELLRYFAILPSTDIPVQDLAYLLEIESVASRQTFVSHLNSLARLGWLEEINNRFFSMHGLVQWVVRQRLLPTAVNCRPLVIGMTKALRHGPTESALEKQRYLPYAFEWFRLFESDLDEGLAKTFGWIARIYHALGDYRQALIYHQKALRIREAVLPLDRSSLAFSYNNIAVIYATMGDHRQCLAYHEKALAIREAVLSSDHQDLALTYSNLAVTYANLGDHEQCLVYDQKALRIREAVLSPNDPSLALSYNNLAVTYANLGDHQQCLAYHQKALAIREAVLRPNHPSLAFSYNNMGVTYANLGDLQQCLTYHQKALAIRELVLRSDHPDLALSYSNLAVTYANLGNYEQCLVYHKKALAVRKMALPVDHRALARSYNYLAATYKSLGDYQKALEYNQEALAIRQTVLPPDHIDIARSYSNLSVVFENLGNQQQALVYAQKALNIREAILSPDHPDLATSYNNLAVTYLELGDFNESLAFIQKAVRIRALILPPDHPDLLLSMEALAFIEQVIWDRNQSPC